jgi:biotin operon repressor
MKGQNKMKPTNEMNKAELNDHIDSLMNQIHEMAEIIENKSAKILELEELIKSTSKDGRKSQVLDILKEHDSISIMDIAKKLNISTKNVSSQLTYLRSDGYKIFTDNNGKKLLVD